MGLGGCAWCGDECQSRLECTVKTAVADVVPKMSSIGGSDLHPGTLIRSVEGKVIDSTRRRRFSRDRILLTAQFEESTTRIGTLRLGTLGLGHF